MSDRPSFRDKRDQARRDATAFWNSPKGVIFAAVAIGGGAVVLVWNLVADLISGAAW